MNRYLIFPAVALALASCSQTDEPGQTVEPAPAAFSAWIGESSSRAAGTQWSPGDAIGISGVSGPKTYTNVVYSTASGDGSFAPVGDAIFYQTTDPVTFTAYYPYNIDGGLISASTADQSAQPSFDFLWAQASGSYAEPEVSLAFAHRMAQINISFTNGNDVDLSDLTFSIEGLVPDGTFDPASGEAKAAENGTPASLSVELTDAKASLIVFPQTVEAITVNASAGGQQYACTLNPGALDAGTSCNVSITVKKTGMTVTGSTITDWIASGDFSGTATMPVPGPPQKGDFFYSDGTYSSNLNPAKTCIGIVFWTPADVNPDLEALTPASLTDDKIMNADFPDCTHGLVVALKDAGACQWMNCENISVYSSFQNTDNFSPADKPDYRPVASSTYEMEEINYVLGYQNTKILKAYNGWTADDSRKVKLIACLDLFASAVPAPVNTTGWYIPSAKELVLIAHKDVDDVYYKGRSENLEFITEKITLAGGNSMDVMWSSTEVMETDEYNKAYVRKWGPLSRVEKQMTYYLRPVLAF